MNLVTLLVKIGILMFVCSLLSMPTWIAGCIIAADLLAGFFAGFLTSFIAEVLRPLLKV